MEIREHFTFTASFQDWGLMAFKSMNSMNQVLYQARAFAAGIVVAKSVQFYRAISVHFSLAVTASLK